MNKVETILLGQAPDSGAGATAVLLCAFACQLLASGLFIAGVYALFGTGWALLAATPTPFGLAVMLYRGLRNA